MKGYHGTFKGHLSSILREGLRGPEVCFTVPDEDVPARRAMAHEDDMSALELARDWGDGTVIEVDLTGLEIVLFEDEGEGGSCWEARFEGSIPPEKLREV